MNHSLLDSYGFQVILKLKQTKMTETVVYYKSTGMIRFYGNDSFFPLWKYFLHYIKMVSVVLENITIIDLFFINLPFFIWTAFISNIDNLFYCWQHAQLCTHHFKQRPGHFLNACGVMKCFCMYTIPHVVLLCHENMTWIQIDPNSPPGNIVKNYNLYLNIIILDVSYM